MGEFKFTADALLFSSAILHFKNILKEILMQEDDVSASSCRHYQFVNHVFDNFFIMLILFILPRIEKYMERDKLPF